MTVESFSYNDELKIFEELVSQLIDVSDSSGGIHTTTIGIEGTKIYTRIVLSSMTIHRILPYNTINHSDLWDFPSISILVRSLLETTHRYLYLIEPGLSKGDSDFRRMLYFYRINNEKYKLLYSEKEDDPDALEFKKQLLEAKTKITSFPTYLSLDKNKAKKIRSGNSDMHFTEPEIAQRYGLIGDHFGFYYRFLSNQTHGSPFATTSQSNTRGRGFENEAESFYLGMILNILNRYLSQSLISQIQLLSLEKKFERTVSNANSILENEKI